ncbi:MAG: prepilin-type N-terminal cleavage/methylation domain-containing protein [Syntrophales bacterium]|jgi:prepilin-type N-terminal cleavage/methylation domain-containing protein|nr:prepilin-type N-terminal cleavage/methylation domain-containing protein [Syntrophales bacterium]MCK9392838.1 prepilin-type N-terminal cleavage/methylation domain-containing protein [Syntrophales bacterium]
MVLSVGKVVNMNNIGNVAAIDGGNQRQMLASFRGFTLLELLISMTLLVLIVVIAIGAMRLSSRSVVAGEKKMEAQERLRTVLSTMDAQIQSHIPLTYQEEGNKKYYFRGDKKTLRFSTNYSIWNGRNGYVIVTYKVEGDPGVHEVLSASEQVPGLEGLRETRFMEGSLISFEYFLKHPAEEQGKWVEMLSDGLAIPEKIRVRVTQGTKQLSLVYPVRVGGKMMAVGQNINSRRQ